MADMTTAEVLRRAADLIEPKGAWTQGAYARGRSGRRVGSLRSATCFCVIGAMDAAQRVDPGTELYLEPIRVLAFAIYGDRNKSVPTWNDAPERTQAEVVAKLREAAALARDRTV